VLLEDDLDLRPERKGVIEGQELGKIKVLVILGVNGLEFLLQVCIAGLHVEHLKQVLDLTIGEKPVLVDVLPIPLALQESSEIALRQNIGKKKRPKSANAYPRRRSFDAAKVELSLRPLAHTT